jgi:hypothetical protein
MYIFVPVADGDQPHQKASITYKVRAGTENSMPRLDSLRNIRASSDSGSKEIKINSRPRTMDNHLRQPAKGPANLRD